MKIDNTIGLPEAYISCINLEKHNEPNCWSATTLLKGVKENLLFDRHFDEIVVKSEDMVWPVWGTAIHEILSRQKTCCWQEKKFTAEVDSLTITGTVDSYDAENKCLVDFKNCLASKIQNKDFDSWEKQLKIYCWLLSKSNPKIEVKTAKIMAIIRDWSKTKALTTSDYPKSPIFVLDVPVGGKTDLFETELFIRQRVRDIKNNLDKPDDEIPPCSPEERWADPPRYAVLKKSTSQNRRALKLFDNEADAKKMLEEKGENYEIQFRPGCSRKCGSWCNCNTFCNYYKDVVCKVAEPEDEIKTA